MLWMGSTNPPAMVPLFSFEGAWANLWWAYRPYATPTPCQSHVFLFALQWWSRSESWPGWAYQSNHNDTQQIATLVHQKITTMISYELILVAWSDRDVLFCNDILPQVFCFFAGGYFFKMLFTNLRWVARSIAWFPSLSSTSTASG